MYADGDSIKKFNGCVIEADVQVREFFGDRIYLHLTHEEFIKNGEEGCFIVRVSPDCTARRGDKIKITVNPDKIYLFDKETETAIFN